MEHNSFRKAKFMKGWIVYLCAFPFHWVLIYNFWFKCLYMTVFLILKVDCLDKKVFNFRYHMLFTVWVLLFLYSLARARQSNNLVIITLRQFKRGVLFFYLDHLHVLDQQLTIVTSIYHVTKVLFLNWIVRVCQWVQFGIAAAMTAFDFSDRLFMFLAKPYFEVILVAQFDILNPRISLMIVEEFFFVLPLWYYLQAGDPFQF